MDGKGGVGLVFVNDEGGSMFLHIHRVIPVLVRPSSLARREHAASARDGPQVQAHRSRRDGVAHRMGCAGPSGGSLAVPSRRTRQPILCRPIRWDPGRPQQAHTTHCRRRLRLLCGAQDGPADMSGMLSPGDRLVAIDGVEIGSAPPGDSPQVRLTPCRGQR